MHNQTGMPCMMHYRMHCIPHHKQTRMWCSPCMCNCQLDLGSWPSPKYSRRDMRCIPMWRVSLARHNCRRCRVAHTHMNTANTRHWVAEDTHRIRMGMLRIWNRPMHIAGHIGCIVWHCIADRDHICWCNWCTWADCLRCMCHWDIGRCIPIDTDYRVHCTKGILGDCMRHN